MKAPSALPEPSECLRIAVEAADERQAVDMRVLDLRQVCDFTDYFVICSGASSRQLQAVADAIQSELRDRGVKPLSVEGARAGRWILMDYGDFLVHLFDRERRDYYRLEDMWSDGADVTASFLPAMRRARASTAAES